MGDTPVAVGLNLAQWSYRPLPSWMRIAYTQILCICRRQHSRDNIPRQGRWPLTRATMVIAFAKANNPYLRSLTLGSVPEKLLIHAAIMRPKAQFIDGRV